MRRSTRGTKSAFSQLSVGTVISARPPGFSTRNISRSVPSGSGMCSSVLLLRIVATLPSPDDPERDRGAHAISAPLTGVLYRSPSPGAEPYVREGGQVNAGQVIGLIEAMKLFNEIKCDVTGTVKHIAAGDGDLVKVRQTLIEVDPT